MARIEKTIFISYRRTDVYTALAVYENLKNQGYDVFFDYRSISSGDFEQIITSNIRARAHFLLILTSTALDRCDEPGDWLRREIELAIDEKRNIIPLFFKGFRFGTPSVSEKLTGKLRNLSRYNGLNVHEDYFDEAMQRLRTQYLNIPLDTILHPVSNEVQKVVRAEQVAADQALEQIEDVKELVKQADDKPIRLAEPDPMPELKSELVDTLTEKQAEIHVTPVPDIPIKHDKIQRKPDEILQEKIPDRKPASKKVESNRKAVQNLPKQKISIPDLNFRLLGGITGGILLLALSMWGLSALLKNPPVATVEPTDSSQVLATQMPQAVVTNTASPTQMAASPAPEFGIGSTMTGKDGMTLLYVPAGEFTMGGGVYDEEKPAHVVYLNAFWIDQTEVTNAMYASCVDAGLCKAPVDKSSYTRPIYYGEREFNNFPVIHVDWNMARTYCEWAGRRLPSEAEWEKAARGTDANIYPWGNSAPHPSLLNFGNYIGDTTEVGSYPDGSSVYGVMDMAGNVQEWVNSLYRFYPYEADDGREDMTSLDGRAVRGGGVKLLGDNFYRSTTRSSGFPDRVTYNLGFRCALSAGEQTISSEPQPSMTKAAPSANLGIGSSMTGIDGMTLLYVPAGEFTMGSDNDAVNEKPVHKVTLDAFWIDQTEVTVRMYSLCVEAGSCSVPVYKSSYSRSSYYGNSDFDNYPVIFVDWNMAKTYCEWADRRLPTEAEWEKSARGIDGRTYPWGENINCSLANYVGSNFSCTGDTTETGKYPIGASIYGALDMAGNVSEWVNDWYSETYYSISPSSNPQGPDSGQYRLLRGGSWLIGGGEARSTGRLRSDPARSNSYFGFRCAMDATP